ncbi:hypothetical protein [Marininema halotolerans]|uniref:Uncharacterized protein n=1 Tax=Marininema halotolerans TaxID=1155944 RepID=A0A1I6R957_9BACL|nr:hypothetical protein [Marininema halotolerans]SFS61225.1 hypothetical protein SAMN05444972_104287 [Marininema halotolerans]
MKAIEDPIKQRYTALDERSEMEHFLVRQGWAAFCMDHLVSYV